MLRWGAERTAHGVKQGRDAHQNQRVPKVLGVLLEEAGVGLSGAAAAWPVIAVMGDRSNQACEGRSSICRKTS
jgi:hypothetical protein